MGNIRGFGGPLTTNWHNRTIRLQHQILQRMRDLGIVPVLPAFAGHVPRAFARLFPSANMTKIDPWNNFEDKYCWYGQRNLIRYISFYFFLPLIKVIYYNARRCVFCIAMIHKI